MGKTFRPYDMGQLLLLPADLRQWLPDDHLALYVSDLVEQLDLSAILKPYEEGDARGQPPYHPQMMVKLLLYGYCVGKMSARKLEQACYDDVGFRVLSGNQQPDHASIAEFRRRHLPELARLFVQVLQLCERAGLVKLGHVAIDGTKIKANASKYQTMTYAGLTEAEQKLAATVARLLAEAERVDEAEDQLYGPDKRGDELPEELRDRQRRLARIRELKADLEREAREAAEKQAAAAKQKNEARLRQAKENGKKVPRQLAQVVDPEQATPAPKARRNFTDLESRMMKDHASNTFVQGYNAQLGVDGQSQIIVAATVVQAGNDQEQLVPVLLAVKQNLGQLPASVSADAGYFSSAAVTAEAIKTVAVHVPPNAREPQAWNSAAPLPENATVQERMWHKLKSKEGAAVYNQRKAIVEPVFAYLKHVRGFRQFMLRGQARVEAEWLLMCLTHNVLKMFRAKQLQNA
ncbi:MAG TPA: IS1182 family transposase [Polyangiaceae bacterium]|nr:IS1182 family transposase [Polyangiaceae bacterium]